MLFALSVSASAQFGPVDYHSPPLRPDRICRLTDGFGRAHLSITCQHQWTQLLFDQGMAMLHGFAPEIAIQTFRLITLLEPDMPAGWAGMALANMETPARAREYAAHALQRARNATELERAIAQAIHECAAPGVSDSTELQRLLGMEWKKLSHKFPDDLAVRALFIQHSMEGSQRAPEMPLREELRSQLKIVRDADKDHAVLAWEMLFHDPEKEAAEAAISSARNTCRTAHQNAVVWRLAGNVCARYGQYRQATDMLKNAIRLHHRTMRREDLLPDQIAGYAESCDHMAEFLARSGDFEAAVALAQHMTSLPATGVWQWDEIHPAPQSTCVRGVKRLIWLLSELERWPELVEVAKRAEFAGPVVECDRRLAIARAAFALKQFELLSEQRLHLRIHIHFCEDQLALLDSDAVLRSRVGNPEHAAKYWKQSRRQTEDALLELDWYDALATGAASTGNEILPALNRPAEWEPLTWLLNGNIAASAESAKRLLLQYPEDALIRFRASIVRKHFPETDSELLNEAEFAFPTASKPVSGELLWQPQQAPAWTMPDHSGKLHSLADYRGRPLLLVFYLGAGCPHCIEQLQAMAPMKKEFEEGGLAVVTVSTDSIEGLADTFQVVGARESLPYLVLSDEYKDGFQTYGAYDQLDGELLHGVYLIDPEGRVRWAERGPEPFLNMEFLLREASRLLSAELVSPKATEQSSP